MSAGLMIAVGVTAWVTAVVTAVALCRAAARGDLRGRVEYVSLAALGLSADETDAWPSTPDQHATPRRGTARGSAEPREDELL